MTILEKLPFSVGKFLTDTTLLDRLYTGISYYYCYWNNDKLYATAPTEVPLFRSVTIATMGSTPYLPEKMEWPITAQ